jgi:hypothetical protein
MKYFLLSLLFITSFYVGAHAQPHKHPACPKVSVETSFISVIDGYPMIFTAKVAGMGKRKLRYRWTLSNGEILEGQGTPEIKVDTLGYQGEAIKATVRIYGLPNTAKITPPLRDL